MVIVFAGNSPKYRSNPDHQNFRHPCRGAYELSVFSGGESPDLQSGPNPGSGGKSLDLRSGPTPGYFPSALRAVVLALDLRFPLFVLVMRMLFLPLGTSGTPAGVHTHCRPFPGVSPPTCDLGTYPRLLSVSPPGWFLTSKS